MDVDWEYNVVYYPATGEEPWVIGIKQVLKQLPEGWELFSVVANVGGYVDGSGDPGYQTTGNTEVAGFWFYLRRPRQPH